MLANSLDGSGSSGRPIAADQKRPTTRASRQSNTTQAILTVIEPPADPFTEPGCRVHLAIPDARVHAGRAGVAHSRPSPIAWTPTLTAPAIPRSSEAGEA